MGIEGRSTATWQLETCWWGRRELWTSPWQEYNRAGKMLLATSKKENLFAADQFAQVKSLLEDPFKSWPVVFQERQPSTRLLPLPVSFLFWYFCALLCWCISCTGTNKEPLRSLLKRSTRTQCTVWTTLQMESMLTTATRRSRMKTSIMEHSQWFGSSYLVFLLQYNLLLIFHFMILSYFS